LLFSEFLAEANAFLVLPEPVLEELDGEWEEPTSPSEQELAALYRECRRRVGLGQRFAVCFVDIDHFKEYSDRYGREWSERVISMLSRILHDVIKSKCPTDGFIAHLGADDFVLVVPASQIANVCAQVCDVFEVRLQYGAPEGGGEASLGRAREGQRHSLPLLAVKIAVETNERFNFTHFAQIAELAMEMKSYAKTKPGSVFVVDRREPVDGSPALSHLTDHPR
jgi:GGDEF domain-containing protein